MCAPLPLTIIGGSPPTARKARTGELTPPGKKVSARCCRECERSSFLDTEPNQGGAFCKKVCPAKWNFSTPQHNKKRPGVVGDRPFPKTQQEIVSSRGLESGTASPDVCNISRRTVTPVTPRMSGWLYSENAFQFHL